MDALLKKERRKEKEKQKSKQTKERVDRQKERMEKQASHLFALRSIRIPSHPRDVPVAHAKYPPGPPCGLPPKSMFPEENEGEEQQQEFNNEGWSLRKENVPPELVSSAPVIEAAPQIRDFREETTRFVPTALLVPRSVASVKRSRPSASAEGDDDATQTSAKKPKTSQMTQ